MTTTVIHHSADYDGLFCREIARKFLPDAEIIGWDFGDALIKAGRNETLYVLDLSPDCLDPLSLGGGEMGNLVWIDHHKSAIEKWSPKISGYRIDGVAACRLAWQWFTNDLAHNVMSDPAYLPEKQAYLNRNVSEPLAVRLAGEYDIWDHRGDGDMEFQFGLRSMDLSQGDWDLLLSPDGANQTKMIIERGSVAMEYSKRVDASLVKSRSFTLPWEGLTFLVLNTGRFNSLTFDAMDKPETGHDALLGFSFTGKEWTVSLYHAAHRKDIDLSAIAVKYGGGGHRGACGFRCDKPPFLYPA